MRYCVLLCIFSIYFLIILSVVGAKCLVPDELIPELYTQYKNAITSGASVSYRRLLKENREYKIHVQKLKDVNGYKRHNLNIKEVARNGEPLSTFYINNPLEAKMPKAYLSFNEFKNVLSNRANVGRSTKKHVTTKRKSKRSQKKKSKPKRRTVSMSGSKTMRLIKHSRGKLYVRSQKFNNMVVNKNATYFPPPKSSKFKNNAVKKSTKPYSSVSLVANTKKDVKTTNISKRNLKNNDKTAIVRKNVNQGKQGKLTNNTSEVKSRSIDISTTEATVSELDVPTTVVTVSEVEVPTTVVTTEVDVVISEATMSETEVPTVEATLSETDVPMAEAFVTETDTVAVTTETEEPSTEPTTTKRSTLARPLVFMGNK